MKIELRNWRIKSTEYCYMVERRSGLKYWKPAGYYGTLRQAAQSVLDQRVRTETTDCVIRAYDEASRRIETAKLIKKIEEITNEILEAFDESDTN